MQSTFERHPENPEIVTVNMGPSHPATHGVLRLVLKLDGERVVKCVPHLGYLHRGMEKIAENRTYLQFIPYTDRMDYLSPLAANVGFALAVEELLGIRVPPRCEVIRVICAELARIGAHLLWLGTHALDLGAATVFFHTFKDREWHYDLIEDLCGARLTTSYTRVGGVMHDVTADWLQKLTEFVDGMPSRIDDYESLLTNNTIWLQRTQGVGKITTEQAVTYGMTGPSLRATGFEYDLRKSRPYSGYENYEFDVPVGQGRFGPIGSCWDRYYVRVEEMRQSVRILRQAIEKLPAEGDVHETVPKRVKPKPGEVYARTEAPRGELGFYIVSDGGLIPMRVKARSPCFVAMSIFREIAKGEMIADMVAIIGSLDIVLGEIDR